MEMPSLITSENNGSEKTFENGSLDIDWEDKVKYSTSLLSKTKPFPVRGERVNHIHIPHVIVMVGLPARGKTYMAKKLTRYLNWIGIKTKVFNVGEYRRRATKMYSNHNFFRPDNEKAMVLREYCAMEALKDACRWLEEEEGEVVVFDATNTTMERRKLIHKIVVLEMGYKLFYVESICNDENIIESNIREVKMTSPDYKNVSSDDVVTDFLQRIEHYKLIYHPLDEDIEDHLSFLKIYDTGVKVVIHKLEGHIQARIVYYLMNIHVTRRNIFLTRHGESEFNSQHRVGGDCDLNERGSMFAKELSKFIKKLGISNMRIWTSWMRRTIDTAKNIDSPQERWKCLNDIDAGVCDGMTYEEMNQKFPVEMAARDKSKFSYRYPRGESYEDLVARLEPVIMELERQENVLLIAHQAVLRCLLAYYLDIQSDELPYIEVPLHTVMKLVPVAYGCEVEYIPLDVPAVSTQRGRSKEVVDSLATSSDRPDVSETTVGLNP